MPSDSNFNCRLGAKRLTIKLFGINALMAAGLLTITVVGRASVDEVARWNQVATDATVAAKINPLAESRIFAILHVAIHDAVNAVEPRYEPYQPRTSPPPAGASVEAAIAGAAHATLVALLPDSKATFDAALQETPRAIADDSRKQQVWRLDELLPRRSSRHGKTTVRIELWNTLRERSPATTVRLRRTLNRQPWYSGGA